MAKTNPIGLRFDIEKVELIRQKHGDLSYQKILDLGMAKILEETPQILEKKEKVPSQFKHTPSQNINPCNPRENIHHASSVCSLACCRRTRLSASLWCT